MIKDIAILILALIANALFWGFMIRETHIRWKR